MILLCGQKINAAEALQWGLVDRLVPKTELDDSVAELVRIPQNADASHIRAIKSMIPRRI